MRKKLMMTAFIVLTALTGCNNNDDESAQPRIGENNGKVNTGGNGINAANVSQRYDHPYNHNYNGDYSGVQNTSMTNDIRSAQQVASRAAEAAEKVAGVERAVAVVQGIDIVVGIEPENLANVRMLEHKVTRAVSRSEQGYNVYATADEDISGRIRTLFTNMNNVKTSNVTTGIGKIIYDIGRTNAR
ncbi:YhcN/YlaJ family sporulation lipoprotein [Bacillus benzoevorans]|uniref:Putative lipoprotein NlpE involved in copper resistance n=1 Tax=Bacillus benzoevorans TaxID=1456 RepID=A0A7X0LWF5_9BACI|nr:YhcN/YlaJ family sporulation lipoprotein [Bacillus benzoevorans]MBB6446638.1 putative lipoprotein NlpE involved in copper resistance [Bacillus benzoevorans]